MIILFYFALIKWSKNPEDWIPTNLMNFSYQISSFSLHIKLTYLTFIWFNYPCEKSFLGNSEPQNRH